MKKRILTIILAMISCVVLLSACGEPKEPKTAEEAVEQAKGVLQKMKDEAANEKAERTKLVEKNKVELTDTILSGSSEDIEVTGYSVITTTMNEEKEDIIYLFLKFTNKFDYDMCFPDTNTIYFSVYQNGIKLNQSIDTDIQFLTTQIQKGASIEGCIAYTLQDTKSDVQLKNMDRQTNTTSECVLKIK